MPNDLRSHSKGRGCCLCNVSSWLPSREYVFGPGFVVGRGQLQIGPWVLVESQLQWCSGGGRNVHQEIGGRFFVPCVLVAGCRF